MKVEKTINLAQNADKKTLSDAELLQLFKENRTDMIAFSNRIAADLNMAEDIVHEAFLRIQAKMKRGYNSNLSIKGYYYSVIRSISIDWIRRKALENRLFPEDVAIELLCTATLLYPLLTVLNCLTTDRHLGNGWV